MISTVGFKVLDYPQEPNGDLANAIEIDEGQFTELLPYLGPVMFVHRHFGTLSEMTVPPFLVEQDGSAISDLADMFGVSLEALQDAIDDVNHYNKAILNIDLSQPLLVAYFASVSGSWVHYSKVLVETPDLKESTTDMLEKAQLFKAIKRIQ